MYQEVLQNLGMSPNEAKIYEALVTFGGSGTSTIALRSKVHRRNAYDTLNRLVEKGLVYEVFSEGETVYEAVEPGKLVELLREKERILNLALPHLHSVYSDHRVTQRAYIYKGLEGMKNYLREALKVGEDMYSFAAKGGWFDPRIEPFVTWFLTEAEKKNMQYSHMFDYEVEEHLKRVPQTVGRPYKFLPKEFSTTSTIDIFGDYVVTFSGLNLAKLDDDLTIFVMVSPNLADGFRAWWKMVWSLLPETENSKKRGTKGQKRTTKK